MHHDHSYHATPYSSPPPEYVLHQLPADLSKRPVPSGPIGVHVVVVEQKGGLLVGLVAHVPLPVGRQGSGSVGVW